MIRVAGGGPVVKRFSIGRRGGGDLRTDTAKEGAIPLHSAMLPDELPSRVAGGGMHVMRFAVDRPTSGGLRSDTALALYSSLLGDADAAEAGEAVKATDAAKLLNAATPLPPQQQRRQLAELTASPAAAERETTPPLLPRIPSGSPAPPPLPLPPVRSAFATEAVQQSSPRDATISAAANAAARLLARAATAGGARPVSWRGPPTPPGMSRSSSMAASSRGPSLDFKSRAAAGSDDGSGNELRTPSMERAASMPEGVSRGRKHTARAAAIRASASVDGGSILGSVKAHLPPTAPCRRSSSRLSSQSQPTVPAAGPAVPAMPPPPPPSALALAGSKTSSELVDELAAELGLQRPAAAFATSRFRQAPPASLGVALVDTSASGWRLLYADDAFAAATGVPAGGGGGGGTFWQHFELLIAEVRWLRAACIAGCWALVKLLLSGGSCVRVPPVVLSSPSQTSGERSQ